MITSISVDLLHWRVTLINVRFLNYWLLLEIHSPEWRVRVEKNEKDELKTSKLLDLPQWRVTLVNVRFFNYWLLLELH